MEQKIEIVMSVVGVSLIITKRYNKRHFLLGGNCLWKILVFLMQ